MSNKKNMLIAQSGGPTAVINASVVGAYTAAMDNDFDNIYAAHGGIQGVLNDEIMDLKALDRSIMDGLKYTPSAGLVSCRYKMSKDINDPEFKKVFDKFDELDIGYFFYNGGNDSMDTAEKLNDYAIKHNKDIKIIGIPKTVDNDLVGTDHCPGFGSAAKYLNATLLTAAYDSYSYTVPTVIIMETMGRHAGWLAASCACAKYDGKQIADRIYLPEVPFDIDDFVEDVNELLKKQDKVFIVVSEGIKDKNDEFLMAGESINDKFGHAKLGGVSDYLQQQIEENIKVRCKNINPTIIQRAAAHMISETDLNEAFNTGYIAVKQALLGKSGYMIGYKRTQDDPYVMDYVLVALSTASNSEKTVPLEWIVDGKNVTDDMVKYVTPLMEGEIDIPHKDGMPVFTRLPRVFVK